MVSETGPCERHTIKTYTPRLNSKVKFCPKTTFFINFGD